MKLNIATLLTLSRIVFIPVIAFLFIYDDGKYRDISAYIFLLALITGAVAMIAVVPQTVLPIEIR